jgi:hypothetical protein
MIFAAVFDGWLTVPVIYELFSISRRLEYKRANGGNAQPLRKRKTSAQKKHPRLPGKKTESRLLPSVSVPFIVQLPTHRTMLLPSEATSPQLVVNEFSNTHSPFKPSQALDQSFSPQQITDTAMHLCQLQTYPVFRQLIMQLVQHPRTGKIHVR